MTYQYDATDEERTAAALLREKGWRISEPPCPACHGMGYVTESSSWGTPPFGGGSISSKPCPNGCVVAAWYFATNATQTFP